MDSFRLPFLLLIFTLFLTSCGVKLPPLPPLAVTPQESDRRDALQRPLPSPVPSESPTPEVDSD